MNEQYPTTNHSTEEQQPTRASGSHKKSFFKQILTAVTAGIVGSALTLGVLFNTNLFPISANETVTPMTESATNTPATKVASTPGATDLTTMIEKASSAIVGVVNYKQTGNRFAESVQDVKSGTGSGVIYKIDGDVAYVVTNNHVIEGAQKVEVSLENDEIVQAEVVGSDALTDLAVLKIDAKHADYAIPFADSDALKKGERVVAIGSPLGLEFSGTATEGILSAVNRTISVDTSAGEWALDVLQTDAAINPGNSGGALVNYAGELIGINSLKIAKGGVEGIGFAIPSNNVIPLVDEMIQHGKVERPYLGVQMASISDVPGEYVQHLPEDVKGGVILASVEEQSPAAKAGLQAEDVITEINEKAINNATEFRKALYTDAKIGDDISITIYRGTEKKQITMTLQTKSN